ncbi:muscarinic acetylcholine receptor DM1-like [Limulus polyphemus]|uniref:Muscarinic acetylcholine receptor DM1-like n=1 Tax=Limulus polyphemus TaxID=6850 RepID=A0ABM1B5T5_LIMPO|nr:muscarinic acetylcholine receptor DM1-like [Limulus polyphemus]
MATLSWKIVERMNPAVQSKVLMYSTASTLLESYNVTEPWNNNVSSLINNSDSRDLPESQYSLPEVILIALVAGLLSLGTVVGNVMVMISFKLDKQLQTISNYFLLSLAVADVSIGLISMPLFTVFTLLGYWPLGTMICDTWLALDYLNSNASVLNLLIISFDRYFSVTRPLTYRAKRTTKRAAFMITSAWVISLVLWPPWIYAWPYIEGQRKVKAHECHIQFLETNSYVTFGTAIAAFYLPVTVMCILYWRIWQETEQRKKDLTHLQAEKRRDSKKSSSSEDPAENEEYLRVRTGSCVPDETRETGSCVPDDTRETTYVPTSLCVEHSQPSRIQKCRSRILKQALVSWCQVDREQDGPDDDSTSHGSPGIVTSGSTETHIQPSSRTTSMTFRSDRRMDSGIPLIARNGPRNLDMLTAHSVPSSTSRSFSSDSVYTILIRLPTYPSVGDGESQASIKMILEEESLQAETSLQHVSNSESMGTLNSEKVPSGHDRIRHSSLRTSESALEALRLPLNAKLVHKQVAKPKKKRKQQERKQEKKAAKTLSAILLAFIVTWTPYNVLVLVKTLSYCADDECIPEGLWNFAYYLCYINSTVNPLCYALCNANFRRTYIRILSCKWQNKNRHLVNRGYFN